MAFKSGQSYSEQVEAPVTDITNTPFCVITPYGGSRTWCDTAEAAVSHAQMLLRRKGQDAAEFYVVRVVKIVRVPTNFEVIDVA